MPMRRADAGAAGNVPTWLFYLRAKPSLVGPLTLMG